MPIKQLTESEKSLLKSKSVASLPDNPSDKGYSADQLKRKQYEPVLYLFDLVNEVASSIGDSWDEKVDKEAGKGLSSNDFTSAEKSKLAGIPAAAEENTIVSISVDGVNVSPDGSRNVDIDLSGKLNDATGEDVAYKVYTIDGSGDNGLMSFDHFGESSTTYGKIVARDNANQIYVPNAPTITKHVTNKAYVDGEVAKLVSGTYVAAKATSDGEGNEIYETYQTKASANAAMQRSNLVTILGEAGLSANGLMSATDKSKLETLYALFETDNVDDEDSVVNTIKEILAIFDEYPEGADVLTALASKVNVSDVVDSLDSNSSTAPLSAGQGKFLLQLAEDRYTKDAADSKFALKATTIAGMSLSSNISLDSLAEALGTTMKTVNGQSIIGDGALDLSNLVTETELSTALSSKANTSSLNNYVEKTSSASKLYGTDGSADATTYSVSDEVVNSAVVKRNASGFISVPQTPTADGHASSKKYVDTTAQQLRAVIAGKTLSYVISYQKTAPTESTFIANALKRFDGSAIAEWSDFTSYIGESSFGNPAFNSQSSYLDLTGLYIITDDNIVILCDEGDLKSGDNIYVEELEVPDRWYSEGNDYGYILETAKLEEMNTTTDVEDIMED